MDEKNTTVAEENPKRNLPQKVPKKTTEEEEASQEQQGLSSTGWWILIIIIVLIDIFQALLDFFLIGVVINRFLDPLVGWFLPFTLSMCGEDVTDPKTIIALIAAFVCEEIPGVDALPFWTLDVLFYKAVSDSKKNTVVGKFLANAGPLGKIVQSTTGIGNKKVNKMLPQKPDEYSRNEKVIDISQKRQQLKKPKIENLKNFKKVA